jgi:thiol-disulfide isomerase/thioredoxin
MRSFNLVKINRGAEIKFFRAVFLTVFCIFFLSAGAFPQAKKTVAKKPAAPKKTPVNLPKVTQIDDAKIRELLKAKDKPLLVNFWATWCVPCREEFPDLVKIDGDYRGKIDFITISLDFIEDIDTLVPEFLSEMKAEMPTYLLLSEDESALISSITKDWNGGLPFTILYNPKGELVYFHQGIVKLETLKAEIEKSLVNQTKITD